MNFVLQPAPLVLLDVCQGHYRMSTLTLSIGLFVNVGRFNHFKSSVVKWLHFKVHVQGHTGLTPIFNLLTFGHSDTQD